MRRYLTIVLLLFLASCLQAQVLPVRQDDVVILYDNDPHGAIQGYPIMAYLKDSLKQHCPNVVVVSNGDFLSGNSYCAFSHGSYIVRLMNAVGYDYATLGNHEFDYGIPALEHHIGNLNTMVLCHNFVDSLSRPVMPSYHIRNVGGHKIGFIAVTTRNAAITSNPNNFRDSLGREVYHFFPPEEDLTALAKQVRKEGAGMIVLIAHVGEIDLPGVVHQCEGIDVVLDGHSHTEIPDSILYDDHRQPVHWTSTGTKFKYIGQVVIHPDGMIESTIIPTKHYAHVHNAVSDTLSVIQREYQAVGSRVVAHSDVKLSRSDTVQGMLDCTMGDFFADAYRAVTGAQIGLMNDGGMRVDLDSGIVTFDKLYSLAPFDNRVLLARISGRCLLDALQHGFTSWPKTSGPYLQVSGITFEVDTAAKASDGTPRPRIYNVQVWNAQLQQYEPLRPEEHYTVGGSSYFLLDHGDGHDFQGIEVLKPNICTDVQGLEQYITQYLHGNIDTRYARSQGRIKVKK